MQHVKLCVFYLVGCYLNIFRVAVNGWGQAPLSYFRMGLRDEKGWEPLFYQWMDEYNSCTVLPLTCHQCSIHYRRSHNVPREKLAEKGSVDHLWHSTEGILKLTWTQNYTAKM